MIESRNLYSDLIAFFLYLQSDKLSPDIADDRLAVYNHHVFEINLNFLIAIYLIVTSLASYEETNTARFQLIESSTSLESFLIKRSRPKKQSIVKAATTNKYVLNFLPQIAFLLEQGRLHFPFSLLPGKHHGGFLPILVLDIMNTLIAETSVLVSKSEATSLSSNLHKPRIAFVPLSGVSNSSPCVSWNSLEVFLSSQLLSFA
ncbi:hypothetical protein BpHYR1_006817 [Brachionus plicatilis]|uniref:Uncharacterized protein n=1 Tax=Brachionus plicatilis TaxID=10195 RepID=A0A3M7S908_BRAPC|nr:hypothetical protein BpHYR1_006817 [Brachionus plicatilis]